MMFEITASWLTLPILLTLVLLAWAGRTENPQGGFLGSDGEKLFRYMFELKVVRKAVCSEARDLWILK